MSTPWTDRSGAAARPDAHAAPGARSFGRRIDCAGDQREPRGGRGLGRPLPSHGGGADERASRSRVG